jgi:hypothetical protein
MLAIDLGEFLLVNLALTLADEKVMPPTSMNRPGGTMTGVASLVGGELSDWAFCATSFPKLRQLPC